MTERRRLAAMVLLFAIGFGLVALASAASASWPLFVTPLPYAAIAWLVVRAETRSALRPRDRGTPRPSEPGNAEGAPRGRPFDRSSRGQDLNL